MAARKAARVLPEPVGAAISACLPAPIAGQASAWAGVGAAKDRANQAASAGWKSSSSFMPAHHSAIGPAAGTDSTALRTAAAHPLGDRPDPKDQAVAKGCITSSDRR